MTKYEPKAQRILIVEDSLELAHVLKRGLTEEGFEIGHAPSGEVALRELKEGWDLVILDLTLPDISGESVLGFIQQPTESPPVLVLTARSQIEDKVALFERGCDDYLTKPFNFNELLGRVRALLRRSPKTIPENLHYDGLSLKPSTNQVSNGDKEITLTPKEFAILKLLLRQPGKVISRKELMRSVWGLTREQRTNFIEVHLANLRKKLAQVERGDWLHTVRSTGISLSRPPAHES